MHFLQLLTVRQIKAVRVPIDKEIEACAAKMKELEEKRNCAIREVGNWLHKDVVVSDNEVCLSWLIRVCSFQLDISYLVAC